jgi:hypothetical protein
MTTKTDTYESRFLDAIKNTIHDDPIITKWHSGGGVMVLDVKFPTVSPEVFLCFGFGPGVPASAKEAKANSTVSEYCLLWQLVGADGWPLEEDGEGEHLIGYVNDLLADVDTDEAFFEAEVFGGWLAATINKHLHPFGEPVETAVAEAQRRNNE